MDSSIDCPEIHDDICHVCNEQYETDFGMTMRKGGKERYPVSCLNCSYTLCYTCMYNLHLESLASSRQRAYVRCPQCKYMKAFRGDGPFFNRQFAESLQLARGFRTLCLRLLEKPHCRNPTSEETAVDANQATFSISFSVQNELDMVSQPLEPTHENEILDGESSCAAHEVVQAEGILTCFARVHAMKGSVNLVTPTVGKDELVHNLGENHGNDADHEMTGDVINSANCDWDQEEDKYTRNSTSIPRSPPIVPYKRRLRDTPWRRKVATPSRLQESASKEAVVRRSTRKVAKHTDAIGTLNSTTQKRRCRSNLRRNVLHSSRVVAEFSAFEQGARTATKHEPSFWLRSDQATRRPNYVTDYEEIPFDSGDSMHHDQYFVSGVAVQERGADSRIESESNISIHCDQSSATNINKTSHRAGRVKPFPQRKSCDPLDYVELSRASLDTKDSGKILDILKAPQPRNLIAEFRVARARSMLENMHKASSRSLEPRHLVDDQDSPEAPTVLFGLSRARRHEHM